jgi:uncharacterized surface protein with fasciclin (FAS1) repeats
MKPAREAAMIALNLNFSPSSEKRFCRELNHPQNQLMKTKHLHQLALLVSLAMATPAAMAQKPATDLPKAGETSPTEGERAPSSPNTSGTEKTAPLPGRSPSQPGRPDAKIEGAGAKANAPVTAVIASNPSFSTLQKAIAQAGLESTLADKSATYTVFAPTDAAFDKLPAGTLGRLMLPENKEKLRSLLLYHVVSGQLTSAEAKTGETTSLNGEALKINATGGQVQVQNASVSSPDMMASNGVVHAIGNVMIPKSLEGFGDLQR